MRPHVKIRECPTLWLILCRQLFGVDDTALACDLYQAMYPSQKVSFALCQAHARGGKPEAVLRVASLIPPKTIMDAAERLVQRRGGIRSKDIITLENRICDLTTRDGTWRG